MKPRMRVRHGEHLSGIGTGQVAQVRRLLGGHQFVSRLAALGFTPGANLRVIQNFGRGPIIVALRGTRVALGRGEARHILVDLLPEGGDGRQH